MMYDINHKIYDMIYYGLNAFVLYLLASLYYMESDHDSINCVNLHSFSFSIAWRSNIFVYWLCENLDTSKTSRMIKVTYERILYPSSRYIGIVALLHSLSCILCNHLCFICIFQNLYWSMDRKSIQISSGFLSYSNGTRKLIE